MSTLEEAITAYKSGNRPTAYKILAQILSTDPTNEPAWLWLSVVTTDQNQKIFSLKKALELNPTNQAARQALDKLMLPPVLVPSFEELSGTSPAPRTTPVASTYTPLKPIEATSNQLAWYRTTTSKMLFFLFFTPIWAIIILTDRKDGPILKTVAALYLVVVVILGCLFLSSLTNSPSYQTVTLSVTSSDGSADISYYYSDLAIPETGQVRTTWSRTARHARGTPLFLMVGNIYPNRGTVGCSITADGKVVANKQASGANAIVTCQGN